MKIRIFLPGHFFIKNAVFDAGKWSPAKWGFVSSESSRYWSPDIAGVRFKLFLNRLTFLS